VDARDEVTALLREIRDGQKVQLERQAEAIALQREQMALVREQAERATSIQDRAEQIQARSAQLVSGSRRALMVVLPIVVVLIAYVSWLIFRLVLR
jgi:hypothetical protein